MQSIELRMEGIVQGVGFRPYVYGLALACGIKGYVRNDGRGVTVVAEGEPGAVSAFMTRLPNELPPLARIDTLQRESIPAQGYERFAIVNSDEASEKYAAVSPDMALCDNCLSEMRDPSDRRHGYWLINCTDCGPRYSIVHDLPYDRPNTSMRTFAMCPECAAEYEAPANRRYHAQPISCHACGPHLSFRAGPTEKAGEAALIAAVAALKAGQVVAVKGLGGFHLMCDATREEAVAELRRRKRRPAKPFAVMFPDMPGIRSCAALEEGEEALIASKERPVVLVRNRQGAQVPQGTLSGSAIHLAPSVAPGIDRIGVFLPYTPLHYRLFEAIDFPLVATSANRSGEPIVRDDEALHRALEGVFDAVLSHDREIVNACDDSVMQVVGGKARMLRLARGFAPLTLPLASANHKRILAVGAQQKNAMALAFGGQVVVTPHIGDLGSVESFEYFERTLETFRRLYRFEADIVVCDAHPGYAASQWARQWAVTHGAEIVEVQHHHAHVFAAMAEYGMREKVTGFAFDGTGFGSDNTVWGGEVFVGDAQGLQRRYHLAPFRLLGGDSAVREPRRAALSLLFECFSLDDVLRLKLPTLTSFSESEVRALHRAWETGINAPYCSSAGRVFDAVASLAGVTQQSSYEGESGLLLEGIAQDADAEPFGFEIKDGTIDIMPMLSSIVSGGFEPEEIAARFMAMLCEIIVTIAQKEGNTVLLCGGVFQNRVLLDAVVKRLEAEGMDYLIPSRFPVNDGAIALGQVWATLNRPAGL